MTKKMLNSIVSMMKKGISNCMRTDNRVDTNCFLVRDTEFTSVPLNALELFEVDKSAFYAFISKVVKDLELDAVVMLSEAWVVKHDDNTKWDGKPPSLSKNRLDKAYFSIDTKERQIVFMADKLDRKVGKWEKVMDYDKKVVVPNMKYAGMALDVFGTGSVLPMSDTNMMFAKSGSGKCNEKID